MAEEGVITPVASLRPGSKSQNLVVKVVDAKITDRPSKGSGSKGGSGSKVVECVVGDATASILFSARMDDDQADLVQPGAFLSLQNANVEMHRGTMRLGLGKAGKLEAVQGKSFKPAVSNNLSLIEFEVLTISPGPAQAPA